MPRRFLEILFGKSKFVDNSIRIFGFSGKSFGLFGPRATNFPPGPGPIQPARHVRTSTECPRSILICNFYFHNTFD